MKKLNLRDFKWINKPAKFELSDDVLTIETEANTDLWQRTHYGFQNDNAPGLLAGTEGDFTFSVKASFDYKRMYDQCGILLYQDSENWLKVSVEHENDEFARLGSVVTNLGYSDWATTDIPSGATEMWYRIGRRGQDFFVENSTDGEIYTQMRVLHFHKPIVVANIGVYACSPQESSFKASFSNFKFGPCIWHE